MIGNLIMLHKVTLSLMLIRMVKIDAVNFTLIVPNAIVGKEV